MRASARACGDQANASADVAVPGTQRQMDVAVTQTAVLARQSAGVNAQIVPQRQPDAVITRGRSPAGLALGPRPQPPSRKVGSASHCSTTSQESI